MKFDMQQCNDLLNLNRQYVFGVTEQVIMGQSVENVIGNTIQIGYDVNYGRIIDDGTYIIEGVTYRLQNINGKQQWFRVNPDKTETRVTVEVYAFTKGVRPVYYYNFGGRWYTYMNGQFNYSRTPPFYQSSTVKTVSSIKPMPASPVTGTITYSPPVSNNPIVNSAQVFKPVYTPTYQYPGSSVAQPTLTAVVGSQGNPKVLAPSTTGINASGTIVNKNDPWGYTSMFRSFG